MSQMVFDLTNAREAGRTASEACTARAERIASFDTRGAAAFILGHLRRHGQMSGEALTDAAKAHGFHPIEDRAFGAIYAGLSRKGLIRCVGYCERVKGHGCAGVRVW